MIIEVTNIPESIFKGQDIKQFVGPEIGLVVSDQEWNLFGDEDDPDSGEHPFDHGGGDEMRKASEFEEADQRLE